MKRLLLLGVLVIGLIGGAVGQNGQGQNDDGQGQNTVPEPSEFVSALALLGGVTLIARGRFKK